MAKRLKLFVEQNVGGTLRRVDRASKILDAFLKQHINRWQDEMWKLNKEYIDEQKEAKRPILASRLIPPTQKLPEATYNLFVKSLKPMTGMKGRVFTIQAQFTNVRGLMNLVRIEREPKPIVSKETKV